MAPCVDHRIGIHSRSSSFARAYESTHTDPKYMITLEPGQTLYGGNKEIFDMESLEKAGNRWWREYE
ncbi:MAG: hypothetical protein IKN79_04335 [Eubacterium sp.]|nr:hypothetical protein [Eubacterium sp.]